ncbi:MAG: ACP S-malonyltransferase [Candidatus Rokubacteria bacterium]|nr:ACP S-malonyltransferase [Candidatus Rokubacteria bacterium]
MTEAHRLAFCFPGQGSQAVGMGRGFYDASPEARTVFEEASDTLGLDVAKLCFEGPEAGLQLTANTQPAILTVSVAAAAALAERGLTPDVAAGHSLGEYSALVVAGALAFRDAVRVVRYRGEFMQEAVPVGTGAMAALLGLDLAAVEAVCREIAGSEVVEVANINSPGQIVIAGHKAAVERAVALAAQRGGKRSVLLPVSAPFHCRLMAPAAERLAKVLETVATAAPRRPVVRNADAGLTTRADEVVPFLVRQVTAPVCWTDCVARMAAEGATTFLEVGPGRVLTGLLKRIDGARTGLAVEDPAGLEKAVATLAGGC